MSSATEIIQTRERLMRGIGVKFSGQVPMREPRVTTPDLKEPHVKIRDSKSPDGRANNRPGKKGAASSDLLKGRTQESEKHTAADRTCVSPVGKEVADIMAAIAKLPDVREEKIRILREAIRSGAYTPDARRIAEKMLQEL
jgi:flagellar biosynthesis anti-sigma factor FlgM